MSKLNPDPYINGLAAFALEVRSGNLTIEAAAKASLQRIEKLDPSLNAFECVDNNHALKTATALDQMLNNATDLGPLMGVTVAVKDIISVDGMPTTNGSNYTAEHLQYAEGSLIKKLRAAGCIVIGKTKTVEFALGPTGINSSRGTPRNPWDAEEHRIPGGSSSGSAVAVASGLCGFALGSDTGGSIRIPACYTGITGLKTTVGQWPTDGVFPLSETFDSIGPLCRSAKDAQLIQQCITGQPPLSSVALKGLRFGIPRQVYFEDLDDQVQTSFDTALEKLKSAGVQLIEFDFPETEERATLMAAIMGPEIIDALTRDGFKQAYDGMDSVTRARAALGLEVKAHEYVQAKKRVAVLQKLATERSAANDAWITPTCLMLPPTLQEIEQSGAVEKRALLSSRNTQPGNLLGMCATSLPLPNSSNLPTGLQLMMAGGSDQRLLAVSAAVQDCLGIPPGPNLDRFV